MSTAAEQPKLCVNCRHFLPHMHFAENAKCGRVLYPSALQFVTGRGPEAHYCTTERDDLCGETVCGSAGRFFEQKPIST